MVKWTPVRLPTPLHNEAEALIKKHPELGYTNTHEFLRDAVREKIATIDKKPVLAKEAV